MAANPYPAHFTDEYWWFVQQLQELEPVDSVFAGAWGRNKPGGHCDAYYLYWHKENGVYVWRNDYTLRHSDDKVVGTPLEQYGAATDWTFKSAQRGDFTNISKYGRRIAVAFANRDPRLEGWHEVLIQADMDKAPEGFNFRSWTTRQPDGTHEWHGHFTCSRKFLKVLRVFQAMISILKGETLAQWQGRGKDEMATVFLYDGKYHLSRGDATSREEVKTAAGAPVPVGKASGEMNVLVSVHRVYPPEGASTSEAIKGYPTIDLKAPPRVWNDGLVNLAFGPVKGAQPPPAGGVTMEQVNAAISGSSITPPGGGK